MVKKIIVCFSILLVCMVGAAWFVNQEMKTYLDQPLKITSTEMMTVKAGTNLNGVLNQFSQQDWINDSFAIKLVYRVYPELSQIKAGTYQLQPNDRLHDVLHRIVSGKEHQLMITFVEGSRFNDWMRQLKNTEGINNTLNNLSEAEIAQRLGIKQTKLEGLFLADTYQFTYGMSDIALLKIAHNNLMNVLDVAWEERQQPLPYRSSYEALIMASIIEKETGVASERKHISSVFVNRLNKSMRLQTDPTVIYGMGDRYDGNIRKQDLLTPTPYNTYTIPGLPPTPIAMVGKESIYAALDPDKTDDFYFVANGKGEHVFSKTLAEHNRAVSAYLNQLRLNKRLSSQE